MPGRSLNSRSRKETPWTVLILSARSARPREGTDLKEDAGPRLMLSLKIIVTGFCIVEEASGIPLARIPIETVFPAGAQATERDEGRHDWA